MINVTLKLLLLLSLAFLRRAFTSAEAARAVAALPACRPDEIDVRGGERSVVDGIDDGTRGVILNFLRPSSPMGMEDGAFHIQGWRWHSMSLMRDSRRLERLADQLSRVTEGDGGEEAGLEALERAASYVVGFNMAAFFRIQSQMFVKFLKEHLCEETSIRRFSGSGNTQAEADAFRTVVGKVEEYRIRSENIGRELYERAKEASHSTGSLQNRQQFLVDVAQLSRRLREQLASMREIQEKLLVPAVARVVPSKVQKSFSNRVLLNLGLLESRTHLVGMHDAVWESGDENEKVKFGKEIPYVARVMIERWRSSLYAPRAGALDYGLTV